MTKTGKLFAFLFSFFVCNLAWATISVQASVDTNQAALDQPITLTVSVLSEESVNIEAPRLDGLEGFRLDGANESTSVSQQLISTPSGMDWKSQRRKDFHYSLTPLKPGRMTIPGFEVKVNGRVYQTQAILVTVSKDASPGPRQRSQQPQGYGWPGAATLDEIDRLEEEMFNQLLNRGRVQGGGSGGGSRGRQAEPEYRSLPSNPNEAFFVQVEVDKTEVYEGEQVTASWYVYTRGQMESLDRVKFPDLRGFWKEIIEEVPLIQFTEEIVNGIPYRKALLASHALFPIKPGTATIDEYKIKSRVRLPRQNFGLGTPNEYTRSSQKVPIKVKALPLEGRPSDFGGAVGQFEVQTSVEGQKFPVNQPFSLRIRFEGMGNAKMIDLPAINWPAGVELYDTKTESKFFKDGRSYKQFDLLMIPRQMGVLNIPEISISLFDPATKRYYTKKTAAIDLQIIENTQAPSGSLALGEVKKEQKTAPPRGPVMPMPIDDANAGKNLFAFAGQPVAILGVYFLALIVLFLKARNELGWGQKRKSLKQLVEKRFKRVEAALKSNDHKNVGAEMMNVFYFLLGEATGQGGAVQELDRLMALAPPSVRRDFGERLKKSFEVYQVLCFAPDEMVKNYAQAENLKKVVKEGRELSSQLISLLATNSMNEES